jgi:UDP-N-acetylmuramoyl-tripeptide--D-alanyl-D-alanine ligase
LEEVTMITIPLFEVCAAIGGRVVTPISQLDYISHVSQNSKEVKSGTIFVAIKGARCDGHDFAREAQDKGAVAVVVERLLPSIDIPQLIVPSSVDALGSLGRIWKGRLGIPLVAVTGSVGKTSTKEMIAHILSGTRVTHKSRENFNNQLGVPLELCLLNRLHRVSVIEIAMRGRNEISYLSKIARPNVGVITNIGMSHIERLGSIENIAYAKAELFEGMDADGVAVLNADDKYFDLVRSMAPCKVVTFGLSENADYRISDIQLGSSGNPVFRINGVPIEMNNSLGMHNAFNAGAAFAATSQLGVRPEIIAKCIASFITPKGRGKISHAACGAIILDSTYNASPDSIRASLYTLSDLRTKGRTAIAVIGEMLELGEHSKQAHEHIGELVRELEIDRLVTVGEYSNYVGGTAKARLWKHFSNSSLAAQFLINEVEASDVVMVQGSRGIHLDIVVKSLEKGKLDVFAEKSEYSDSSLNPIRL